MTDAAVIGAFVFMVAVIALTFAVGLALHWLHDVAEDREREAEYAEAWRVAHWSNQRDGRYDTDIEGRPE